MIKIKDKSGLGEIVLYDRVPKQTDKPIDYFSVKVTGNEIIASARVYAYSCSDLPELFIKIKKDWKCFRGPACWKSTESEFKIEITHDGSGHYTLISELRSGFDKMDWLAKISITFEVSQLDNIARDIRLFIGQHET